jgi:hypothetical protein
MTLLRRFVLRNDQHTFVIASLPKAGVAISLFMKRQREKEQVEVEIKVKIERKMDYRLRGNDGRYSYRGSGLNI